MALNAEQIRALAAVSRPTLEVVLFECRLACGTASQNAFVECLQSDRPPTELVMCRLDSRVLANALAGNSRVTKLRLGGDTNNDAEMAFLLRALTNNRGLVDLDLQSQPINDENWTILCESLKAHPALTSLHLRDTSSPLRAGGIELTDDQKAHRTGLLAEVVQENRLLHTIELSDGERDGKVYTEEVLPRLEFNLYGPRVLAISKADIQTRRPLLGLALQTESVLKKSNLLWMLLSENADVVLQLDEDSEQVVEVSTASAPAEVAESAQLVVEATCNRKRKR
jgi:hypothetical protein